MIVIVGSMQELILYYVQWCCWAFSKFLLIEVIEVVSISRPNTYETRSRDTYQTGRQNGDLRAPAISVRCANCT